MPGARRPFFFSQDACKCVRQLNRLTLEEHNLLRSEYLEISSGWQHYVHSSTTRRSVAQPYALLMNHAEREATKVHHRWSSLQTSVMPYGGVYLCNNNSEVVAAASHREGVSDNNTHCLGADGRLLLRDLTPQRLPTQQITV